MKSSPVLSTTHAVELANASGASMSLLTTVPTSGVAGLGTDCEFPCN